MPIRRQFAIILNTKIWVLTNLYVMQLRMMTNHCSPIIEMLLSALNSVVRNDFLINEQVRILWQRHNRGQSTKGNQSVFEVLASCASWQHLLEKFCPLVLRCFFAKHQHNVKKKKKITDKTPFRCRFGSELLLIHAWTFSVSFQWFSLW